MKEATYELEVPKGGAKIEFKDGKLTVPDNPIIPFIEGDGIGVDITPVMRKVVDAAVEKAYTGKKKIHWMQLSAGKASIEKYNDPLPKTTVDTIREYKVSVKGPLTTPVGGGYRSLNVTMRQTLELFACVRPVRWYKGVPTPMKSNDLDIVVFRENTEDVYAGIEWDEGTPEAKKVIDFISKDMGKPVRADSGIGIKPVSITGTKRLVRAAIEHAIEHNLPSITLMHKGNIMKFTEARFKDWGYQVATEEFRDRVITEDELWDKTKDKDGVTPITKEGAFAELRGGKPPGEPNGRIIIKDRIADAMFQQVLLRPKEYSVIATLNLNGDYISDACAAQVGGLGIAPGANINFETGIALFEPTHGTAPKYRGQDKVNPSSLILSGCMMLRYMGWNEAADLIESGLETAIQKKTVTYDLARQIEGAKKLKCSEFGDAIIEDM